MNKPNILYSAEIVDRKVYFNGKLIEELEGDFGVVSKQLYKTYCKNYIKFFKMDSLCKLGFLTSEILLKDFDTGSTDKNEVAIVVGNSNSTKNTDIKYHETTKTLPSPAIFVYTLPNILLGEICIRYGFKGQNLCYISDKFDEKELYENIKILLNNSTTQYLIGGWVDYVNETNYKSVLLLIGKDGKNCKFGAQKPGSLNKKS